MGSRNQALLSAWGLTLAALLAGGCTGEVIAHASASDENPFERPELGSAGAGSASSGTGGALAGKPPAGTNGGGSATGGASGTPGGPGQPPATPATPLITAVRLVPQAGITGVQRVNFAVPFSLGQLSDAAAVRVLHAGAELATARRVLATHPDGSIRSLQLQVEPTLGGAADLELRIGELSTAPELSLVAVADTLLDPATASGPRVWPLLAPEWLSQSGVAGAQVPEAQVAGTTLDAWSRLCDYDTNSVDSFLQQITTESVWLYDRGTVNYRGYARRGDLTTLRTAYLETTIYRDGLSGHGADTTIGLAGKASDLKYYYAQNLAIHYLLTGDDRFRESAEDVATRISALWSSPEYAGGDDFWTERHAGFALLAYVWAGMISDDRSAEFRQLASTAVDAYVTLQNGFPVGHDDARSRCFAHSAVAHGEDFGYFGCSPWMSAILADALDAYAAEAGGAEAQRARESLVKLARSVASSGRDDDGRPYYWMGVPAGQSEPDEYEEHWGESAYVVALGWHHGGRSEPELKLAADELAEGFALRGEAPHMRSVNWQCRSAVAAAFYLK